MEEKIVAGVGATLRKNLRQREGQFTVTFGDIIVQLKKLLALWLIVSVVLSHILVIIAPAHQFPVRIYFCFQPLLCL